MLLTTDHCAAIAVCDSCAISEFWDLFDNWIFTMKLFSLCTPRVHVYGVCVAVNSVANQAVVVLQEAVV